MITLRVAICKGYHGKCTPNPFPLFTSHILYLYQWFLTSPSFFSISPSTVTHKALNLWYKDDFAKKVVGFDVSLQPGDLVWLETPRNPTCEIVDLEAWGTYLLLSSRLFLLLPLFFNTLCGWRLLAIPPMTSWIWKLGVCISFSLLSPISPFTFFDDPSSVIVDLYVAFPPLHFPSLPLTSPLFSSPFFCFLVIFWLEMSGEPTCDCRRELSLCYFCFLL